MNQQLGGTNIYSCRDCQRIVWLMAPGASDQLRLGSKAGRAVRQKKGPPERPGNRSMLIHDLQIWNPPAHR